jgi:hypothetical protein
VGQRSISLEHGWSARRDVEAPAAPLLISQLPPFGFSEILALENYRDFAVVQIGISDNPLIGSSASDLDREMHSAGTIGDTLPMNLVYYFFPQPRQCAARLTAAAAQLRLARATEFTPASQLCQFGTTPFEFYSAQLSTGETDPRSGSMRQINYRVEDYYLPPMEVVEANGLTFYVFEAQGQHQLEQADLDRYGLPNSLHGARTHFFWAIGAPTPFPFVSDPWRKDVQLIHVVYATLSLDGDARDEFRQVLEQVRWQGR